MIAIDSFDLELWNFRGFLAQRPESPKSTFGKLGKKHGKYQSIIFSFIFNFYKFISWFPNPIGFYRDGDCFFSGLDRHFSRIGRGLPQPLVKQAKINFKYSFVFLFSFILNFLLFILVAFSNRSTSNMEMWVWIFDHPFVVMVLFFLCFCCSTSFECYLWESCGLIILFGWKMHLDELVRSRFRIYFILYGEELGSTCGFILLCSSLISILFSVFVSLSLCVSIVCVCVWVCVYIYMYVCLSMCLSLVSLRYEMVEQTDDGEAWRGLLTR